MKLSVLHMFGIVGIAGVTISGLFSSDLMYVATVSLLVRLIIIFGIALAIAPTPYRTFWLGFAATVWYLQHFRAEPIFDAATRILISSHGMTLPASYSSPSNSTVDIFEVDFNGPSMVYGTLVQNTYSLLFGICGGLIATWFGRKYAKQSS